jgi:hypothetical protein
MAEDTRDPALRALDPFVGEWAVEARFASGPEVGGRLLFEWALDGRFLVERSEVDHPEAPDSLAIISVADGGDGYVQHYFDSRGVVRIYRMTLEDGVWTLLRTTPDFTPLTFSQRYTGRFSEDGAAIDGRWETSHNDGATWERDFDLNYRRISE